MSQKLLFILAAIIMVPFATPCVAAQAVPSGTDMLLRLETPISTRINRQADQFTATVVAPREFEGATVYGHVRNIDESGKLKGRTEMSLSFDSIEFRRGDVRPFRAHLQDVRESDTVKIVTDEGRMISGNRTNQTLKRSGIGAAIGGALGGALGGGKGALLGVLLGGGAGAGSLYAQGAREIRLEPGTELEISTGYNNKPRSLARSDYGSDFEQDPRMIQDAQNALSDQGYDPGDHDGHMGWRTREAIRNFQRDQGLAITGVLDEPTADRLGIR
jgi:hypothetical protein